MLCHSAVANIASTNVGIVAKPEHFYAIGAAKNKEKEATVQTSVPDALFLFHNMWRDAGYKPHCDEVADKYKAFRRIAVGIFLCVMLLLITF